MSEIEEENYNPKTHKSLLQNLNQLNKAQFIQKTTRNETQNKQVEFKLVNSKKLLIAPNDIATHSNRHPVVSKDVVNILKYTSKHIGASKLLKTALGTRKILERPLEKPVAERLSRTIGYEKVKGELGRWDPVVATNRTAETQVFPLRTETIYIDTSAHAKPLQFSVKSDLANEIKAVEAKLTKLKKMRAGDFADEDELRQQEEELLKQKLTHDELIARRKELAYLKMRESQKSAKARLRNKIKSKKYHKLMKKQKIQEQLKEFELLQKTNPEAALEKLNSIERVRMLERANLRHKNTGTWAKNLQVRAKYDKDVRKDLAEQLQISRQLTQNKSKDLETEGDDDENEAENTIAENIDDFHYDPFNPWTKVGIAKNTNKNDNDGGDEATKKNENWRKYWMERNENEKLLNEYKKLLTEGDSDDSDDEEAGNDIQNKTNHNNYDTKDDDDEIENNFEKELVESAPETARDEDNGIENIATQRKNLKNKNTKFKLKAKSIKKSDETAKIILKPKKDVKNSWTIEELSDEQAPMSSEAPLPSTITESKKKPTQNIDIDELFDNREVQVRQQQDIKLKALARKAKEMEKLKLKNQKRLAKKVEKSRKEKDALKNLKDLSFKTQAKRPLIDEELNGDAEATNNNEKELNELIGKSVVPAVAATTGNLNTDKKLATGITAASNDALNTNLDPNQWSSIKLRQPFFAGINNIIDDSAVGDADFDDSSAVNSQSAAEQHQLAISEAFEDIDIIADFSKDKAKDSALKNTEVDLFMPGWGSWAGAGISEEEQATQREKHVASKRLLLKLAKEEKRRDDNKDGIYINEDVSKHLRPHLVTQLPFPFTSIADYEASIRAPIGRNYIPETAFRMLTRPSIITQKGQIIEPMDEHELVKPKRKFRHVVDRRIRHKEEVAVKNEQKDAKDVKDGKVNKTSFKNVSRKAYKSGKRNKLQHKTGKKFKSV